MQVIESTHKTMTEYLCCFCNPRNNDWDTWLLLHVLCITLHHTQWLNTPPCEVLFGRKANIPGQLQQKTAPLYNYDDIVHDVKQKLQVCHKIATENLMQSKQQRAARQSSVNMPNFTKGDRMLLWNEKAGKLDSLWEGPYVIDAIDHGGSVIIELSKKKKIKVHVNRLKVYHS